MGAALPCHCVSCSGVFVISAQLVAEDENPAATAKAEDEVSLEG